MKETLLFIIIVLAIFSIIKVLLLIAYSYVLKPKVDKDGNIIAPKNKKDERLQCCWLDGSRQWRQRFRLD